MTAIAKYIQKELIAFLSTPTRDEVLRALVDLIGEKKALSNKEDFHLAILEREKIVSTGIGMGVAIPHAKLPHYDDFFIAIGILNNDVEWDSIDGVPVRLVFLIGGPDDKQTEYLQILSNITLAIKDEGIRKALLTLKDPEEIVQLFKNY